MSASNSINIQQFIDNGKFGGFQILTVALCALVVLMDGFDTQAIGYVAPALVKAWHINRAALSPVFAIGLVGLMIGALTMGPVADRFGRKPVLLFCTLVFGVFSLLTATADSIGSLMVFRFLAGLGLGGAMPNAIALTGEYTPRRIRTTTVMIMFCGFSLGAALGGVAAAGLIAKFGWQSVFILGGVIPIVAFIILIALLPESIRYLAVKGGQGEKIAAILSKVKPGLALQAGTAFVVDEQHHHGFPVKHLFTEGRAAMTTLLWVVFFMGLLDLYFLSNWLPIMLHDSGISVERSVMVTATLQIGGTIGTLVLGRFFDRYAPFRVLACVYFLAAIFIFFIGSVGTSPVALFGIVFGAGFCVIGAQIGANALAAGSYPTMIRSTGVGWALGIGRVGSITGPMVGGLLLSLQWPITDIFMIGAVPMVVAGAAAFLVALQRKALWAEASAPTDAPAQPVVVLEMQDLAR